ncbi:DEAD/DEAH box helicase [Hymenobacter algoricola]|uniref:ATP-dependent helicase n=1 Tax=Hymenobacter algoricola TaxID=486267 RepID=A0ABP7MPN2_9BACT
MPHAPSAPLPPPPREAYVLAGCALPDLTEERIGALSAEAAAADDRRFLTVEPERLAVDSGTFRRPSAPLPFPTVTLTQEPGGLTISCPCPAPKTRLCEHQGQVLRAVLLRPELRVFFDQDLRQQRILVAARHYGLEQEPNPADYFRLEYADQKLEIMPRLPGLYPLTADARRQLAAALLPASPEVRPGAAAQRFMVLGTHKYYDQLTIHLFEAALTAGGKPKNPLTWVAALDAGLAGTNAAEGRFYAGVARLQQPGAGSPAAEAEALRAVVLNPLGLPVFGSRTTVSEKTTAQNLTPLTLAAGRVEVALTVRLRAPFYEVAASVQLNGQPQELTALPVKYGRFVSQGLTWYLVEQPAVLPVLAFFRTRPGGLLLHRSAFPAFEQDILARLGRHVAVAYPGSAPATPAQLAAGGFAQAPEKLLYLTESGDYVDLVPVMKYGAVEVPVLSRNAVYATDPGTGKGFTVARDAAAEIDFMALLVRQHPDFAGQLGRESLSMSRRQLLADDWFLEAFAVWHQQQVTVLGFNELKNNKLNPYKATVTVRVGTEVNWFDTELHVHFGPQKAPLASILKALRNRRRYVLLGDGTHGLLPQHWLDRLPRYLAAGEVVGERIRTPKVSFSALEDLYEPEALTPETRAELARYQAQVTDFGGIEPVAPPPELRGTLRPYQQHGLNWLCFLDKFGFGGCLADDMGLGKTITVLALLLLQRTRRPGAVSLVVVPTSLVFNWQAEAARFAPALRLLVVHGSDRPRSPFFFTGHDVVLTTYGTLLTDLVFLQDYPFNYVVLDESQAIKNPESQRYQAARRLQARNRLVLTGTPLENSTYDLYGQLSFACPGLLGSQQHFRDQFATPIDKFKSTAHARALQHKIRPFVLRRTKQQVAAELPAKTEMVLHCEMDAEQRQVYDLYRKEYREWLMGKDPEHLPKHGLHLLQGLTKLRQICNSPALLSNAGDYGTSSAKLRRLLHEIEDKAPRHKILVFSQFVGMLDLVRQALTERGIAAAYLTGQTTDRAAAVAAFQQDESVRVFLISLKAGGTGLNLTAADYVYLVDPWWNPAVENQAIDRSHRLGQTKPVVAVRLICPGTIEERIQDMQARKQELATDLIRTDTAVLKSLSAAELLALFS